MPPKDEKPPVTVYPSPKLHALDYVPGVPVSGIELSWDEAQALLASGVVTTTAPVTTPSAPKE